MQSLNSDGNFVANQHFWLHTSFIYLTSKANFIMKIVHQAQLLMAFSPTQSGRPFEFGWRTQFPLLLPQTCLRPLWSPPLSGVWSLASEYNNIYLLCSLSDLEAADPILTRWLFSTVHISFFSTVHIFFFFTEHFFCFLPVTKQHFKIQVSELPNFYKTLNMLHSDQHKC